MLPTLELLGYLLSLQLTALAYKSPSTSTSLAQDLALFCILEDLWAISAACFLTRVK
jgi:hypothetical protein